MVVLSEKERQHVERAPLPKFIFVCMVSYIGYLILGVWCLMVEMEHEEHFEAKKAEDPEFYAKGAILELQAAYAFIIFSGVRILCLFIFFYEKEETADTITTIWLSISTFSMIVAYFTACLNLYIFIHIHFTFVTFFFICIAIDFIANVLILTRNVPTSASSSTDQ